MVDETKKGDFSELYYLLDHRYWSAREDLSLTKHQLELLGERARYIIDNDLYEEENYDHLCGFCSFNDLEEDQCEVINVNEFRGVICEMNEVSDSGLFYLGSELGYGDSLKKIKSGLSKVNSDIIGLRADIEKKLSSYCEDASCFVEDVVPANFLLDPECRRWLRKLPRNIKRGTYDNLRCRAGSEVERLWMENQSGREVKNDELGKMILDLNVEFSRDPDRFKRIQKRFREFAFYIDFFFSANIDMGRGDYFFNIVD